MYDGLHQNEHDRQRENGNARQVRRADPCGDQRPARKAQSQYEHDGAGDLQPGCEEIVLPHRCDVTPGSHAGVEGKQHVRHLMQECCQPSSNPEGDRIRAHGGRTDESRDHQRIRLENHGRSGRDDEHERAVACRLP